VASFHLVTGAISFSIYFLFSRQSSKASIAGIITPKILNQTGMQNPAAIIST